MNTEKQVAKEVEKQMFCENFDLLLNKMVVLFEEYEKYAEANLWPSLREKGYNTDSKKFTVEQANQMIGQYLTNLGMLKQQGYDVSSLMYDEMVKACEQKQDLDEANDKLKDSLLEKLSNEPR